MTYYQETVAPLISQLREAAIDYEVFEKPLALCQLSECRATCCHDGVILSAEEADFIGEGIVRNAAGKWKTQTVPARLDQLAKSFPDHFPKTRCVFLDEENRCQWQLKSMNEGKHPWFYKPISCWMHPLNLEERDGRLLLTLELPNGSGRHAAFAPQTPCGALGCGDVPARVTLKNELEMLHDLSGRDFLKELNAPSI